MKCPPLKLQGQVERLPRLQLTYRNVVAKRCIAGRQLNCREVALRNSDEVLIHGFCRQLTVSAGARLRAVWLNCHKRLAR
jgi:hypothetical protein